jgi:hypothetical protein
MFPFRTHRHQARPQSGRAIATTMIIASGLIGVDARAEPQGQVNFDAHNNVIQSYHALGSDLMGRGMSMIVRGTSSVSRNLPTAGTVGSVFGLGNSIANIGNGGSIISEFGNEIMACVGAGIVTGGSGCVPAVGVVMRAEAAFDGYRVMRDLAQGATQSPQQIQRELSQRHPNVNFYMRTPGEDLGPAYSVNREFQAPARSMQGSPFPAGATGGFHGEPASIAAPRIVPQAATSGSVQAAQGQQPVGNVSERGSQPSSSTLSRANGASSAAVSTSGTSPTAARTSSVQPHAPSQASRVQPPLPDSPRPGTPVSTQAQASSTAVPSQRQPNSPGVSPGGSAAGQAPRGFVPTPTDPAVSSGRGMSAETVAAQQRPLSQNLTSPQRATASAPATSLFPSSQAAPSTPRPVTPQSESLIARGTPGAAPQQSGLPRTQPSPAAGGFPQSPSSVQAQGRVPPQNIGSERGQLASPGFPASPAQVLAQGRGSERTGHVDANGRVVFGGYTAPPGETLAEGGVRGLGVTMSRSQQGSMVAYNIPRAETGGFPQSPSAAYSERLAQTPIQPLPPMPSVPRASAQPDYLGAAVAVLGVAAAVSGVVIASQRPAPAMSRPQSSSTFRPSSSGAVSATSAVPTGGLVGSLPGNWGATGGYMSLGAPPR